MMEVKVGEELERNVRRLGAEIGVNIISTLSKIYLFDEKEAMEHLKLNEIKIESIEVKKTEKKTEKKKKSGIPMPFCGTMCEGNCRAIRLNHGLYTQCTNTKTTSIQGHGVCGTCEKQIEKKFE